MLKDTIKAVRKANHLSQLKFAERLDVTQGAVAQWEKGFTKPTSSTLTLISSEFGIPLDTLMKGEIAESDITVIRRPVRDEDLKFALFGGENGITQDDLEEVKRYAEFLKMRKHSKSV